jgi:drug/metabolite transporter (DMT)-like permease
MNRLVRLYPAAWRDRYGDEFSALLEDIRLSPFDMIDILFAAVDAHLHPQPAETAANLQRDTHMTRKHYGWAAMLGGTMFIGTWLVDVLYPLAAVGLLLALAGLSAVPGRRRTGRAWLGFLLPAAGVAVSLVGVVLIAALADSPLIGSVRPYHVLALGVLGLLAGSVVFALDTLPSDSPGRKPAAAILIGAIAAFAGMAPQVYAWTPTPSVPLLAATYGGSVLYGIGWIWLGYTAIRQPPVLVDAQAT